MKIGTTILLFVVILIAFGFVISDDLHVRDQNNQYISDIQKQNKLNEQIQGDLSTCENTVLESRQVISDLKNENAALNGKVLEREKMIASMQAVDQQYLTRIEELETQNNEAQQTIASCKSAQNSVALQSITPTFSIVVLIAQAVLLLALNAKWKLPFNKKHQKNGYVRLTPQERDLIVRSRRGQKN